MGDRGAAPPAADVGGTLLAALRPDGHFARWTIEGTSPVLCNAVIEAARVHQVGALVHHALADDASTGVGLSAQSEAALMVTVAQNLRVCSELATVAEVLDAIGAPWVTVKGPVLAELAYPNPALRPYADLDVLVHPRSFGAAVAALEAHGAQLVDQNWTLQYQNRRAQSTLRLPHGTSLDLHWHLVNDAKTRDSFSWDMDSTFEHRREVMIAGTMVPTLDPVDTVLHVALHAALSGGHRLLWSRDLAGLTRRGDIDWDVLVERARSRRLTIPVAVMLRRAHRLLSADVPPSTRIALDHPRRLTWPLAAVEHLATTASIGRGRHTGRFGIAAARADTASTGAALAAELRRKLERSHGGDSPNPLHRSDPDSQSRERYLEFLERAG